MAATADPLTQPMGEDPTPQHESTMQSEQSGQPGETAADKTNHDTEGRYVLCSY